MLVVAGWSWVDKEKRFVGTCKHAMQGPDRDPHYLKSEKEYPKGSVVLCAHVTPPGEEYYEVLPEPTEELRRLL